ncbi:MAG: TauD/TfdA family dioxygenase, partial [Actinobacteria bacterium]|nr:TauD/TfdA family dioxygenase [Actinomycetota bacterium]
TGATTRGIVGMSSRESSTLLDLLRQGLNDPAIQCRWHWQAGDVVIWDERCTNHRATSDHFPQPRLMRRCTAGTTVPRGLS